MYIYVYIYVGHAGSKNPLESLAAERLVGGRLLRALARQDLARHHPGKVHHL